MSLWDLLTLMSGGNALGSALAAGLFFGAGRLALMISAPLGAGLGFLSVVAAYRAGLRLSRYVRSDVDSPKNDALLAVCYLAQFVWCFAVAPLISFAVVAGVIRVALLG
ncbi:hypothetical protein FGE12_05675 [Aggregicoccus sp. 17bor-14]|uniref:hypothetical protein n=1 Tax=Myxococcaceae TaxID=31 RepID=UPI00129CF62A|nr:MULTISPECIES: hypothetical protein [Myxococcaceae]MBF5041872.1 hypothetical protein [Simulacricoccus sp. 17bor-14]MRI87653.1 hypothetical protein [Aggregicoccus sp. 17bor-14]